MDYADAFSWDESAEGVLEVLERVWRGDEEAGLPRFYLTLNMFGTLILSFFDLDDGYE